MPEGLLGLDEDQLKQLMKQFGASPEDTKAADNQAAFALGFGLLGGRRGDELNTIGRAGLGAMAARQSSLEDSRRSKALGIETAGRAMTLQQQLRAMSDQAAYDKYRMGQAPQGAPTGMPVPMTPPPVAGFGMNDRGAGPMPSSMPAQSVLPPGVATGANPYDRLMAQADAAEAYAMRTGNQAAAKDAAHYREQALKWREKMGEPKVTMVNGKPAFTRFGEYGGNQAVRGAEPPPDIQVLNLGNRQQAIDKYRTQPGQTFEQGVGPDTVYSGDITKRGQNMTDARARDLNAITQGNAVNTRVGDLRKEFNSLPQVKSFAEVQPVIQSAREAMKIDTSPADLNLIYAAAKIFDPGSVVRESETEMVMKSGSPAERFKGTWNYVIGGGRLTKGAREQLMQQIESRARGHEAGYESARKAYSGIAKKQGIAPEDIFIEPFAPASAGVKQIVRTGTRNGKKVVQYSDGTIEEVK